MSSLFGAEDFERMHAVFPVGSVDSGHFAFLALQCCQRLFHFLPDCNRMLSCLQVSIKKDNEGTKDDPETLTRVDFARLGAQARMQASTLEQRQAWGASGGKARRLTAEQRTAIARNAAQVRWFREQKTQVLHT